MRWGPNVLDWRSHAITKHAKHPLSVLTAKGGHLMMIVTTLHKKPSGAPRQACAALRFDRAMAEAPGRTHPPRSGDDEPDPQAWSTDVSDRSHRRVMSNPAPLGPHPDRDTQISAP